MLVEPLGPGEPRFKTPALIQGRDILRYRKIRIPFPKYNKDVTEVCQPDDAGYIGLH